MKHLFYIVSTLLISAICLSACGENNQNNEEKTPRKKVLVAYFSATGKTKKVAEDIARISGGDLHEIIPEKPYTPADLDWRDESSRSYIEMHTPGSRPVTVDSTVDISSYDVIFIGYPIWWDMAPAVINTFIDKQEFGKRYVIPFATSGGSQIATSVDSLRSNFPGISWNDGKLLNSASDAGLQKCLSGFGIETTAKSE